MEETEFMNIGGKLKKLRLEMKKTLKEQSEFLGVSINTIYRWEKNITIPRKHNLAKLAEFYDKPLDGLLFGNVFKENMQSEALTECQLMEMFRKLSADNKYRVLGYMECLCVEKPM